MLVFISVTSIMFFLWGERPREVLIGWVVPTSTLSFIILWGSWGRYMYIEHLKTKLENLVNIKKYLLHTYKIEVSKYWTIRQKIKDDYKVINGQCVFKALNAKIKLLDSYGDDLSQTLKEIKEHPLTDKLWFETFDNGEEYCVSLIYPYWFSCEESIWIHCKTVKELCNSFYPSIKKPY